MPWVIGVDEAGYGPNLGPFVMSAVACRLPKKHGTADLWQLLGEAVRKSTDGDDGDFRLVVDDSKRVYSPARGLDDLERSVLGCLGAESWHAALGDYAGWACPDCLADLRDEAWFRGDWPMPVVVPRDELEPAAELFDKACSGAGEMCWLVRSVVVCAPRFNAVSDRASSKAAVLADSLGKLLHWALATFPGDDGLAFFVDKHGGRNSYAASLQHFLSDGIVTVRTEGALRSSYRVDGLSRPVELTFQPRADQEHFCVALASMASKYLRELLMLEFNRFWGEQVPGVKPTAGYPGDSARFYEAIRPALDRLGLVETAIWRAR